MPLAGPRGRRSYGPEVPLPWLANPLFDNQQPVAIGRNRGIASRDAVGSPKRIGGGAAGALSIGDWREADEPGYRRISLTPMPASCFFQR